MEAAGAWLRLVHPCPSISISALPSDHAAIAAAERHIDQRVLSLVCGQCPPCLRSRRLCPVQDSSLHGAGQASPTIAEGQRAVTGASGATVAQLLRGGWPHRSEAAAQRGASERHGGSPGQAARTTRIQSTEHTHCAIIHSDLSRRAGSTQLTTPRSRSHVCIICVAVGLGV